MNRGGGRGIRRHGDDLMPNGAVLSLAQPVGLGWVLGLASRGCIHWRQTLVGEKEKGRKEVDAARHCVNNRSMVYL